MKKVRIFIAAVLFLIFFVWAFAGNFGSLFLFHLPTMIVLFLLASAVFAFVPAEKLTAAVNKTEPYKFYIFPAVAFLFSLAVSLFIFRGLPHVPDEMNYKYLAEAILDGKITTPLHPHYEFFHFLYTNPAISGTYSIYQIGFSIFLAPFVFLKVPFLCNPLLNAAAVFLIGKTAEEFYGKTVAFVTMALASLSLYTALMGGTLMAHSFCAVCTLGAFYLAVLSVRNCGTKRVMFAAVSALFISFLMFIRPQNALFALIFIMFYLFVFIDKKSFFKLVPVMGGVIFLFFLLFVYSNYAISGKITEFKYVKYWNISEPENDCMGLGLGKGCRFGTPYEMPENGLTLPLAFEITSKRLYYFVLDFIFSPFMLLFLILAFLLAEDKLKLKKHSILLTGYLIFFVVYFFYYYIDSEYGYGSRYYYECMFFLFPPLAEGILATVRKSEKIFSKPFFKNAVFVPAFIASALIFQTLLMLPIKNFYYSKSFWIGDKLLSEALKEKNIDEGVVFIFPDTFYADGAVRMNLHKIDENKLIFAHSLDYMSNQNLMDYYKGRKFYTAFFSAGGEKKPEIFEIHRDPSVSWVTAEAEYKNNPVDGAPDYCNKFPQYPDFINKSSGFTLPEDMISKRVFFFCRFTEETQFYTFGQNFEKEGIYKVRITFAATPESGKFYFESGNFSKKIDFYSQESLLDSVEFDVFFKKGMNFIKLSPDLNGRQHYFIIDKFEFFPSEKTEALQ
ncbi:hypothetical protein IKS86_07880 [bacterium]|nr:hypothetical protein [bacterium]